jgi:predicted nucleic acid-binding protein
MALAAPVFCDTSVLVAGLIEMGDASTPAEVILDAIASRRVRQPLTAWHCILEFYSVATRLPGSLRLDPQLAGQLVREEILRRFEVCDLPPDERRAFVDTVVHERVAGGRVYDAHIAEAARLAGARLVVTDNRRHFVALLRHGIRVLTAAEFAEELDAQPSRREAH